MLPTGSEPARGCLSLPGTVVLFSKAMIDIPRSDLAATSVSLPYNEAITQPFMVQETTTEIHQLTKLEEFAGAVRLQREIWGFQDVELLPLRLFVVASKIGGQVLGAFHGSRMIAFCLCIPGLKPGGKSYLHSHMLGVLPKYRNTGLGRALKLKQREYALASGVDLIEWTFDPLEIKNAFFNIERLGAIVRRYVHNQYGTTSSHLHGGLPTDRLISEWWIRSCRVEAFSSEQPFERPSIAGEHLRSRGHRRFAATRSAAGA